MAITSRSGANFIDLKGRRFGRWLVVERTAQIKKVRWICECDCGTVKEVASADLKSGRTNSCGCILRDRKGTTFNGIHQREYRSWSAMKQRCYYAKHNEYHRYGGRGISMCDSWRESFSNFYADMGNCPDGFSIDRIDNNGDYCPSNCKWSGAVEQSSNTSRNVNVEYEGRAFTLKQLAAHIGVNYYRLHAYYRRRRLPLEDSISRALQPGISRPYRYKPE